MDPIVFVPYLRPMVWGGRSLETMFHKPLSVEGEYGESWEVSAHREHVSLVAEGPFRGTTLLELCQRQPEELFGSTQWQDKRFPL